MNKGHLEVDLVGNEYFADIIAAEGESISKEQEDSEEDGENSWRERVKEAYLRSKLKTGELREIDANADNVSNVPNVPNVLNVPMSRGSKGSRSKVRSSSMKISKEERRGPLSINNIEAQEEMSMTSFPREGCLPPKKWGPKVLRSESELQVPTAQYLGYKEEGEAIESRIISNVISSAVSPHLPPSHKDQDQKGSPINIEEGVFTEVIPIPTTANFIYHNTASDDQSQDSMTIEIDEGGGGGGGASISNPLRKNNNSESLIIPPTLHVPSSPQNNNTDIFVIKKHDLEKGYESRALKLGQKLITLDHPNITKTWHFYIEDDALFLSSENPRGISLERKIRIMKGSNRHWRESEILNYMTQICSGVKYLHDRGLIHGSLKTKNIYFDRGQNPNMDREESIKFTNYSIKHILPYAFPLKGAATTSTSKADFLVKQNTFEENISRETQINEDSTSLEIQKDMEEERETTCVPALGPKFDIFYLGALFYELCALKKAFKKDNTKTQLATTKINPSVGSDGKLLTLPNLHAKRYSKPLLDFIHTMLVKKPSINYVLKGLIELSSGEIDELKINYLETFRSFYECSVQANLPERALTRMESSLSEDDQTVYSENTTNIGFLSYPDTSGIIVPREEEKDKLFPVWVLLISVLFISLLVTVVTLSIELKVSNGKNEEIGRKYDALSKDYEELRHNCYGGRELGESMRGEEIRHLGQRISIRIEDLKGICVNMNISNSKYKQQAQISHEILNYLVTEYLY